MTDDSNRTVTRRQFAATTGLAALSAAIVPSRVFGAQAPSNTLNIAAIGIGGMGAANLKACEGENIVALCDVDSVYSAKTRALYPKATTYTDYRVMLEKEKGIDAVVIATPDHTHAMITMACLEAGKHVYCQKPLTHTVAEARTITEAARRHKVVTQMGNQGHSFESMRLLKEWPLKWATRATRTKARANARRSSGTATSATSPRSTRGRTGRSAATRGRISR
jgi:predicted dehydrogenase